MCYTLIQDETLAKYMVIEADNYNDANMIAEWVGIYFDGHRKGIDNCNSCGDRWRRHASNMIAYGNPIIEGYSIKRFMKTDYYLFSRPATQVHIFYKNGNVRKFSPNDMVNCATKGNK
jgi:hypothetical protein